MQARESAVQLVQDAPFLSLPDRIRCFVQSLPILPKHQVPLDDSCPICLLPFQNILEDLGEILCPSGALDDEGEEEGEEKGITKVDGCGHLFCRRDLAQWIRSQHGNCPTCRSQFVPSEILAPLRDDDESSDGGEYIPPSEGDDDYDYTFSEMEFEDDEDDDWGVDADSEPIPPAGPDDVAYTYGDAEMWEVDYEEDGVEEEHAQEYMWRLRDYHDESDHYNVQSVELEGSRQDGDEALEVGWGLTDGESNRSTSSASSADLGLGNAGKLFNTVPLIKSWLSEPSAEEHGATACVQTSASRSEDDIEGNFIADDTIPK